MRFILWFLKLFGWKYPEPIRMLIPEDIKEILYVTELKMAALDLTEGTSGEYRRHQVFSRLMKLYPKMPHYKIALAIEIVNTRRKGETWL